MRKQKDGRRAPWWIYNRFMSYAYINYFYQKKIKTSELLLGCFRGDPWGNRTPVTAVKGRCLNRLTNGPYVVAEVGFEPTTCRV